MLRVTDYAFSAALILFAAAHGFIGSPATYGWSSPQAVWSFSGTIAAWMIAAVNILRAGRPGDRSLAVVALAGAVAWIGLIVWLASLSGAFSDIRMVLHIGAGTGLAIFSVRSIFLNTPGVQA